MVKFISLGSIIGTVKITKNNLALHFLKSHSEDQAMKKFKGTIVAVVVAGVFLFGNLSAWAGHYKSFVDQRRMSQEQRIQAAWQAGQLTPEEYQCLENQQQQICMIEKQMRADGRLDPAEKTTLNEMLNQSEWAIDRCVNKCWSPGYYQPRCGPGW
jgi:hypothetical protein